MGILRSIISVVGLAGLFGLVPVTLIILLFCIRNKAKHPKAPKIAGSIFAGAIVLTAGSYLAFFLLSAKLYSSLDLEKLPTFTVTSDELHDGVWDPVISNTPKGKNRSPSLSWEPVQGASCYAVCMVDETASDWLHWKQSGIRTAGLAAGAAPADAYVGPYPPSGTHVYTVYVFALKEHADFRGTLDFGSMDCYTVIQGVDLTNGDKTGNVIAYGTLSGTFSHAEE